MELLRTANAGILLKMDGTSILLDGVCRAFGPYLGTPEGMALRADAIAFTHEHPDHYDASYAEKNLRLLMGPQAFGYTKKVGNLLVEAIPTRHIGKADCPHMSFRITGSQSLLFTGDASPLCWKDEPQCDVLVAPFAYASTKNGFDAARRLGKHIVIVHMPKPDMDEYGLWNAVRQTAGNSVQIPEIGETVCFP